MELMATNKPFSVDPVVQSLAVVAAVAGSTYALVYVPGGCGSQSSVRVLGTLRDDVDDAVDRVCAPNGAAGPANDLDSLDILQQHVLHLPIDTSEERRIDAPPVN